MIFGLRILKNTKNQKFAEKKAWLHQALIYQAFTTPRLI